MSVTVNGSTGLTFNDGTSQSTSAFYGGLALRNRIINGAMMIDQRNAGASVTASNTSDAIYVVDRWAYRVTAASKISLQQSTVAPAGFKNSLLVTSLSAYSIGSSEFLSFRQPIEGLNVSDLGWGTADAQSVTLSFRVRSSLTGTFGGYITNSAENRLYVFSYTISAANTWETKSVTIAGDTSGTWLTTNGVGLTLGFMVACGSTLQGTAGSWGSTVMIAPTGQTNLAGTNGATFYITGVQLEKGSTATSFDYRPYGTELALCQRYLQIVGAGVFGTKQSNDASYWYGMYYPKVSFRVKPTSAVATAAIKLDYPGTANYTQSSANASVATFSSADAIALQCANFTSLVAFSNLVIRDDGGVIQLSAEL